MKTIIGVLFGFFLIASGIGQESDRSGIERWKEKSLAKIASLSNPATMDEIWSISVYIRIAERGKNHLGPEHLLVFNAAREVVLRTDNHAAIYRSILEKSKITWKATGDDIDFSRTRSDVFKTLSQLPSPQVVELLGSMLHDTEWPIDPLKHGDSSVPPSNAILSVFALQDLLEEPPANHGKGSMGHLIEGEFPVWQLWYDHVKAGSRTFRFKDDPKPYNFQGVAPVPRSSTPLLSKTQRAEKAAPKNAIVRNSPNQSWLPLALALLALVAAGVWFLKSRHVA